MIRGWGQNELCPFTCIVTCKREIYMYVKKSKGGQKGKRIVSEM